MFVKWTGKSGVGRTFWVEGTVCAVTQRTTKPGISASVGQRVEVGGLKQWHEIAERPHALLKVGPFSMG